MLIDTKEINERFKYSWEILATFSTPNINFFDKTQEALHRLTRSLKWILAYNNMSSYCGQIIQPYNQQYSIIIKKFWVQYFESNFISDNPPTPQDFFEWYCDSKVIKEEEIILI